MDQIALGKRIKAARERVGMTQEDLAAAVLHATELSERLKTLSPEGQRKVMNVLDTLVDELR